MTFHFADLFAGIGGFHAALSALGGEAVLAAEIDPAAREVYSANWGLEPRPDVTDLARSGTRIPDHDVLTAGFPCQPYSKGGRQKGMRELRGLVFHDLIRVIDSKRPAVLLLENVRNLYGPRQRSNYDFILDELRRVGYRVSSTPTILSPHQLPKSYGGSPQIRERLYITAVHVGGQVEPIDEEPYSPRRLLPDWNLPTWDLRRDLPLEPLAEASSRGLALKESSQEFEWLHVWQAFLDATSDVALPGHPLWSELWNDRAQVDQIQPKWKRNIEHNNLAFYRNNKPAIDKWLAAYGSALRRFPKSRQKFEWQAQDAPRRLDHCLIQFRPSGIRVKKPNYAPALVAMGQTSLYGPEMRWLTPREVARLQGFPDSFVPSRDLRTTYRQFGNAVHVGSAYFVLREYVLRNRSLISAAGGGSLVSAVDSAPSNPAAAADTMRDGLARVS